MSSLMVSVTAYIAGVKEQLSSEKGAVATEYGLLIAFVAFAIIVGAIIFGTSLSDWFEELGGVVASWTTGPS